MLQSPRPSGHGHASASNGHHDAVKDEEEKDDDSAEKAPEGGQEEAKEESGEQAPREESEGEQKEEEKTDEKKTETDDQGDEKKDEKKDEEDGAKGNDNDNEKPTEDSPEKEKSSGSNEDEDPHGGLLKENDEAAGNERGPANEKPSDDSNGDVKKNEATEESQSEITPTHDMHKPSNWIPARQSLRQLSWIYYLIPCTPDRLCSYHLYHAHTILIYIYGFWIQIRENLAASLKKKIIKFHTTHGISTEQLMPNNTKPGTGKRTLKKGEGGDS